MLLFGALPVSAQFLQTRDYSHFSDKRLVDWSAPGSLLKAFSFHKTTVIRADFSRARLIAFRFELSQVIGANFGGADLRDLRAFRTLFQDCDFRGADLRRASFVLSSLKGSLFNDSTQLPFPKETALQLGMKYEKP